MNIQHGDVLKARNLASGTQCWMSGYANWYAKRNPRTGVGCHEAVGEAEFDAGRARALSQLGPTL
jgi:hypothetical protein